MGGPRWGKLSVDSFLVVVVRLCKYYLSNLARDLELCQLAIDKRIDYTKLYCY